MHRVRILVVWAVGAIALVGVPGWAQLATQGDRGQSNGADARRNLPAARFADVPPLRRPVTLDVRDERLEAVLESVDRQADLHLTYDPQHVPLDRPVTIKVSGAEAGSVLAQVLRGLGLTVRVDQNGQTLLERALKTRGKAATITGSVADKRTGQHVAGVDVFLNGTRWKTTTDSAGQYRLADVDSGTYILTARRLGYVKQSQQVAVRGSGIDTVNVMLVPAAIRLDELVTTSTGPQRRRDIGNAVTTLNADSLMRTAPIRNLTDLLENHVPGLTVQHTSGAPGDPSRLRLRGLNSVTGHNDPVVVVDGMRIYAAQADARSGNLSNFDPSPAIRPSGFVGKATTGKVPAPSPLDQIDPNTIDKVEVFKGPSAATLYGPDAANGVIVITTKRGKPGPTRWNSNVNFGRTTRPGRWSEGYFRFGRTEDGPTFCALTDLQCTADSLVRFQALNDPSLTVLAEGRRSDVSLTAEGGNQALTFSVTGTYGKETGLVKLPDFQVDRFRALFNRDAPDWMRRPQSYTDWNVRSAVTAQLGPRADVTLSTQLARSEQQRSSLEDQLSTLAGTYVDKIHGIYYSPRRGSTPGLDGSAFGLNSREAYLADYYTRVTASSFNFTTGVHASWRPKSWLTAAGDAGVNIQPRDDQTYLPEGLSPLVGSDSGLFTGAFVRGTGRAVTGTFNLQGAVRKPIGHGFMFETALGANIISQSTSDIFGAGYGLVPGTKSLSGAAHTYVNEARTSSSVFGWYIEPRITGQRFSLSTGLRLDGGNTYGTRLSSTGSGGGARSILSSLLALPKLNGSWMLSEEPFFPFKSLFSSLRLRGAYGQSQIQPGAADRLRLYTAGTSAELVLTGIGNTELRPERSTEFEGGIDADLLDSRVSIELTAYRKSQVDALLPVALPGSVNGGGTVVQNIGNIRNTGSEMSLTVRPVQSHLLTWSVAANYAGNTNTLVKLGKGVAANPLQGLVEGYPLYGRWAQPILGFADQNGNGVLDPSEVQIGDSLVFLGRLLPAYTSSFSTNLALFSGALSLSADFSYDAGATQVDQTAKANWVLVRALVDPSAPFSEQAAVISADTTTYGLTQDVSSFRFNSFSVNYRAPARLIQFVRARELTIALQGRNLALHTSYNGKDPNVTSWSAGENIVDTGQLPQPRTWQLAVFVRY